MKARLIPVKRNIAFSHKFYCPIDKRYGFVQWGEKVAHFGAVRAYSTKGKPIEAVIDWEKMEVRSK